MFDERCCDIRHHYRSVVASRFLHEDDIVLISLQDTSVEGGERPEGEDV